LPRFVAVQVPLGRGTHITGEKITTLEHNQVTESSRREKIQAMLVDDPTDVFLRYSLALELEKEGEHEPSLEMLAELARDSSPYVPAFFMAAQQLVKLARVDEARDYLRDGIEEARSQGDDHAAGEMSEFLTSLGSAG